MSATFVGILFRDEIIGARGHFEQRLFNRQFGSIVRMEIEFAVGRWRTGRIDKKIVRKSKASQTCRSKRSRRNCLAATNKKSTPVTANKERVRQTTWLFRLAQSAASSISKYRTNTIRRHSGMDQSRPRLQTQLRSINFLPIREPCQCKLM